MIHYNTTHSKHCFLSLNSCLIILIIVQSCLIILRKKKTAHSHTYTHMYSLCVSFSHTHSCTYFIGYVIWWQYLASIDTFCEIADSSKTESTRMKTATSTLLVKSQLAWIINIHLFACFFWFCLVLFCSVKELRVTVYHLSMCPSPRIACTTLTTNHRSEELNFLSSWK